MSTLFDKSFADDVGQPISQPLQVLDFSPAGRTPHWFKAAEDLGAYLDDPKNHDYTCRVISICQLNSWKPLQVTRPMLDLVTQKHGLTSSVWELSSCFYARNLDVEEVFCYPPTLSRSDECVELSYTVRYPQHKTDPDEWRLRQTGICHRLNTKTSQSVFVLFNPVPNSLLYQELADDLLKNHREAVTEPFWLHALLFSTYFPAWREYIASMERAFLPIAGKTFSTFIDEPLRVGYDNLGSLVSLQNRFAQVPTILEHATDVLAELSPLLKQFAAPGSHGGPIDALDNLRRSCVANARTAAHLQKRAQTTAGFLSDTLSFRDQVVAKEQNSSMLQLNKSAVFLTTLTLFYLPASFVATLFGMNFFGYDEDNQKITATSMVWIYAVVSVVLTAFTVLFYYWLLQHNGSLFRRLSPKVRMDDWHTLKRHFTLRGNPPTELQRQAV